MPKFTEDVMKRAVLKVTQGGYSVNHVAREVGLCKKTLKSYVDKYENSNLGRRVSFKPNYEINQVFTNDLERVFEEYLISADKSHKRITRDFMRSAAYQFATSCNVHVPKTWNVRKQAGLDWMYGYLNRHPTVKSIILDNKKNKNKSDCTEENEVLATEFIEINTVDSSWGYEFETEAKNEMVIPEDDSVTESDDLFCVHEDSYLNSISVKTALEEFHENLVEAYSDISMDEFVSAERVYNLGEILLVAENPSNTVSVTACLFINAAGQNLPPFFILPRKTCHKPMFEGMPEGADCTTCSNGTLNDESFILVLKHFQSVAKSDPVENKVVLLMDDDDYHVTINSIDFCQKHGIVVVTIPTLNSNNFRPIDNYVVPLVRTYFNRCIDKFLDTYPLAHVNMYHLSSLFCKIYEIVISNVNMAQGFADTGLYPLDEQIILNKQYSMCRNQRVDLIAEFDIEFLSTMPNDDTLTSEEKDSVETKIKLENDPLMENERTMESIPPMGNEWWNEDIKSNTNSYPNGKTPNEEFLENFKESCGQLSIYGGLLPEKIFCLDELELLMQTNKSGNEERSKITLCCSANAAGEWLPPFLMYENNDFRKLRPENVMDGMEMSYSPRGEVNDVSFLVMLQHFQKLVLATPKNRVMLIMDCEACHISLGSIDYCKKNGIVMVTIPPSFSTPFLPIEKTVFPALVKYFQNENRRNVSMEELALLMSRAFKKCCTSRQITNGFAEAGLWPLNEEFLSKIKVDGLAYEEKEELDLIPWEDLSNESDDSTFDKLSCKSGNEVVDFFNDFDVFLHSLREHESQVTERIYVMSELNLATEMVKMRVFLFASASGKLLPPFVVYSGHPEDVLKEHKYNICPVFVDCSSINELLCYEVIKHFSQHSHASPSHEVLLLVADEQHLGDVSCQYVQQQGIHMQAFPTKEPQKFHPLEEPLLNPIRKIFTKMIQENNTNEFSVNDVASFLVQTLERQFQAEKIVAMFEEYGLCSSEASASRRAVMIKQETKLDLNDENLDLEDFIIEEEIELMVDDVTDKELSQIVFVLCNKSQKEYNSVKRLKQYDENSWPCRYCSLQFCNAKKRNEHEDIHIKNNKHPCFHCGKQCASKAALVQHLKKHQPREKWITPKIPGERFNR